MSDFPRSKDFVSCVMLPLYHTAGYTAMIDSLALGVRFVVIPALNFVRVLQTIQEFKVYRINKDICSLYLLNYCWFFL